MRDGRSLFIVVCCNALGRSSCIRHLASSIFFSCGSILLGLIDSDVLQHFDSNAIVARPLFARIGKRSGKMCSGWSVRFKFVIVRLGDVARPMRFRRHVLFCCSRVFATRFLTIQID